MAFVAQFTGGPLDGTTRVVRTDDRVLYAMQFARPLRPTPDEPSRFIRLFRLTYELVGRELAGGWFHLYTILLYDYTAIDEIKE